MFVDFPKVAVLLAAYNGMQWIEEQLVSIRAQKNVNVHIYISVDPSTDGTEVWCANYSCKYSNVYLLPSAGPFMGAARNFFRLIRDVNFSGFDYISFSDQDDIWYPDKLERAINSLCLNGIDGYSSNVIAFWTNGRRILLDKAQPQVEWDHLFEAAGPGCTYVLNYKLACAFKNLVITRWEEVQEVMPHDWFCYAFARSNGFKWFIDPVPSMDYRQHESNQAGANVGVISMFSRAKQVVDGWWFSQVKLISVLVNSSWIPLVNYSPLTKRISYIRLAIQFKRCRRRRRDQAFFVLICICGAIFN